MPESAVNNPAFWVAFVLAELSLPLIVPNKRWAGAAMFLVALWFLASAFDLLRLPFAPPLFPVYLPLTLVLSLVAASVREFQRDRNLKQRLLAMHSTLSDFALEISQRVAEIEVNRGSETKGLEHDKWIEIQFKRQFEKPLVDLFGQTIRLGWFDRNIATKLLDLPFRGDGPMYWISGTKIGVVAAFINGVWDRRIRPSEWVRRPSAWSTYAASLLLFAATWLFLFHYT